MVRAIRNLYRVLIILFVILPGCSFAQAGTTLDATISPTMTMTFIPQAELIPTANRQAELVPSLIPSLEQTSNECAIPDDIPPVHHNVVADVNYEAHTVNVQQTIRYTNTTSRTLSQMMLIVEPNRWNQVFSLTDPVRAMGAVLEHTLDGKRLTMSFPEPLQVNCELIINLDYQLAMPLIGVGVFASKGFFGYSQRQLNLGHWLATVPIMQDDEWVVRDSFIIGEQEVLEESDWDVTLILVNAPENLTLVAPGTATQLSAIMWRYVHNNARDFAVSLSDAYNVRSQVSDTGVTIELYTFDDAIVTLNDQEVDTSIPTLEWATTSLEMYTDLFGGYPYERLVIVQGDFPDGMEFSGLVYVGGNWFINYPGGPGSYLMLITVHEVAHQWWYAQIGNDSALNPWLDEALSTYSEYIYIEEFYPALTDWWWQFRVESFAPAGYVDSSIYQFDTTRSYINAVYLRGVRMLDALRADLGTEAFFDLLYAYTEVARGQIATPELFWSLFTPEQLDQTQLTRETYFYYPQVEVGQ